MTVTEKIAAEIGRPAQDVGNVIRLLDEGNTIPFIARYRKEMHGSMDDTSLRKLEERLRYLRNLEDRRQEIFRSIREQGKMTSDLEYALAGAETLSEIEDIYRPYKQKRRTRATVAREKGLEPLAEAIFAQKDAHTPENQAERFVKPEKGVEDVETALNGARDIIAEWISDSPEIRRKLRNLAHSGGCLQVRAAKQDHSVYETYYDFLRPISRLQGHQILAINRGEKEEFLKVSVQIDRDTALSLIRRSVIRAGSSGQAFLETAVTDSYDRLILPSVSNEIRAELTESACAGAIEMFAMNLKPLLMQPPVRGKVTMGLDPGYRMGCKVAVVDATGKVLDTAVVYPTHGDRGRTEAIEKLGKLIRAHDVAHIAIGNGTASRETEGMVAELLKDFPGVSYMVVSEAGASVYSVSELAAEEFPQYDVNLRSAVSIARRLQDPLSELVKIDPKAIGVGQYQHDMPQKQLGESLDAVVEDCVNSVGVDLNTASTSLLRHVAGLNASTAKSIVAFREENGAYSSRKQLLKVPKIGAKAFEQCAGFLRIAEGKSILDNTGVHPESYPAAEKLLALCGVSLEDVKSGRTDNLIPAVKKIGEKETAETCGIGIPTMRDILSELTRPGRDPRESLPTPIFRKDLLDLKDLETGMILTGTVRNVTDFGAFVDVGVHQDGLVHISEMADRYLKHPSEAVSVGDEVRVCVLDVDVDRKRISLSMKRV